MIIYITLYFVLWIYLIFDIGVYTCSVFDDTGLSVTKTLDVTVVPQPTIVLQPRYRTVNPGKGVNMTCLITAPSFITYPTRLNWYKDGVLIVSNNGKHDNRCDMYTANSYFRCAYDKIFLTWAKFVCTYISLIF